MIEETLFTRLSTYANLTALIGTSPVRLYPVIMPEGTVKPAVTYQLISKPTEAAMGTDPGLAHARYQFTAWAETMTAARNVIKQVRLALERYRTTGLQDCLVESEYDLHDDAAYIFGRGLDVIVHHTEDTT